MKRIPRDERRNLNPQEMAAMDFVEMQERNDDDGWPYPDTDPVPELPERVIRERREW